jgi:peptidoglycan-N-acetylglucosamine deacetylase
MRFAACTLALALAAPAFADCSSPQRVIELAPGAHAGAWPEGFTPLALKPKEVVLTFDDGPDPASTPPILDLLKANCVKATFFPIGPNAAAHPDLVKRELAEGHSIGGHTWDHAPLPDMKLADAAADIYRGFQPLRAAGAPIRFFRFPQLAASSELLGWLKQRGITAVSADIDPGDWAGDPPDQTLQRLKGTLKETGGGIVILHDSQPNTAKLLPGLIEFLHREGYSIVQIKPAAQADGAG